MLAYSDIVLNCLQLTVLMCVCQGSGVEGPVHDPRISIDAEVVLC